jgi:hypothetical protein
VSPRIRINDGQGGNLNVGVTQDHALKVFVVNQTDKKTGITLDLNSKSLARLEKLKNKTRAESQAAVISQSLKLFEWYVEEVIDKNKELYTATHIPTRKI